MDKRKELIDEREKIKKLEDEMRKEAEAIFKDFRPKYQYKVVKIDLEKNERIFYRGDEINTIIRVDIKPAPGIMHEFTGLHLKARKMAPYIRLNIPVLSTVWHTFLVSKECEIVPYRQSYVYYDLILTRRSMCIEPMMRVWLPSLIEGEEEKIETYARWHNDRVVRIEHWIKMGYPDNELVWTEEIEDITKELS